MAALSGCTAVSHVSAELDHGSIAFAFCDTLTPTEVEVLAAPSGPGGLRYKVRWEAEGNPPIPKGDVVKFGVPPTGFVATQGPTEFPIAGSHIDVLFEDTHGSNPGSASQAVFDGGKLVNGKWLNWNGRVVSTPCSG
jgi:hypothetical protein